MYILFSFLISHLLSIDVKRYDDIPFLHFFAPPSDNAFIVSIQQIAVLFRLTDNLFSYFCLYCFFVI